MRFPPIEQPKSLYMRIVYWAAKRHYGKVPMVMKVLYARRPALFGASYKIVRTLQKIQIDGELALLIHARTSQLNGCGYCRDITEAEAVKRGLGLEKFVALEHYEESDCFNERERSVLRYVTAVVVDRSVPGALLDALSKHFTDDELLDIAWLTAAGAYFNALAMPLGVGPDGLRALAEQRQAKGSPG